MEANKKRMQVHMLPTKGVSRLAAGKSTGELRYLSVGMKSKSTFDAQHLYYTSDDEIKEGDWCIINAPTTLHHNNPQKCIKVDWVWDGKKRNPRYHFDKVTKTTSGLATTFKPRKIEVSTDPELTIETSCTGVTDGGRTRTFYEKKRLPQPSQATIEAYCKNPFDECDVEMIEIIKGKKPFDIHQGWSIKVDPNHNTVTTLKVVEKTYSKEDMHRHAKDFACWYSGMHSDKVYAAYRRWLKEGINNL